jgi:hypothetical protein
MPRLAGPSPALAIALAPVLAPVLAIAACWREPASPPPLRASTAPEADPPSRVAWRGTCGDESYGWREAIAVTLTLRDDGEELVATGTLVFAERRARAQLRGRRSSGARHTLLGEMNEVGGLGTRWGLVLEVEPGQTAIRGRFIEVLDAGGEQEMCRFVWSR